MNKPLLVLFDGNALIHRAFHALPPLTIPRTGEPINAVYGFASMLIKVLNDLKPTHIAVAFDRAAPTFRHKMYDQYKAQRPETPSELVRQFTRVRDVVRTFDIPIFELDGFEADDVLGTLSVQAEKQGAETIIVTGDGDTMQLVTPDVKVLYPKPGRTFSDTKLYGEPDVVEKYGVKPNQISDLKALVGDTSDNIPGVKGIGEKTAVKLLSQFGSVDAIYQHLSEVTPPRLQQILRDNEAAARQSKELATIITEAPVTLDMAKTHVSHYDRNKVTDLFRELEFFSLVPKLPQEVGEEDEHTHATKPAATNCHIINTEADLDELVSRLSAAGTIVFDTETTGLNAMTAKLVGISISLTAGEAYYIPVGHEGLEQSQLPLQLVLSKLRPVLENGVIGKIAQNGKYDMTILAEHGATVNNLSFDTMIAAHLLGDKALDLKSLAFNRLGIEMTSITDLIGTGAKQITMAKVSIEKAADYSCADADLTGQLAALLEPELRKQNLWRLFSEVEMPLVTVLMRMERYGIALDTDLLQALSQRLGEQVRILEAKIYSAVGHEFNINSPQQLSEVLFTELHLESGRKTRSGPSTGAAVLEELRGVHPAIDLILEYRQLTKLKSTYIDALPGLINPKTGRVHTNFNQARTATGRLSSSDPNLQNIPIRTDVGKEIRQAFVAPPGSVLLSGDYSQIDLRALAHLSQDPILTATFHRDEDVHRATAAQLFNVKPAEVTADMRRLAKTVNFGVIYGMSEYGLEQATELSREEAGKFITAYFDKYPGVKQYMENTKNQVRKLGYVQTILGRKRYVPEVNAGNRMVREAAERMATNMPVQGTSADIIKVAMINLDGQMAKRGLKSKMLLQVHDELVFEVPENELAEMKQIVPEIMTHSMILSVPLKVDLKIGRNWGEME